ncbi:sigma-70 family RNA polymerase sigma factor [Planctomycetales bacterium ZRK34]|nr:sigma-70 family RNA polymerase sigma factor [Planctomycetales bacterium ZRK34]
MPSSDRHDDAMPAGDDRPARFMKLFNRHSRQIYAYILCLVGNTTDVDDLHSETNLAMWQSFDQFDESDPQSDFAAWGRTIARYRVLRYFDSRKTAARQFSTQTIEALSQEVEHMAHTDRVHETLGECLQKLPPEQYELIRCRYLQAIHARKIAEQLGISVFTLYKRLAHIRQQLLNCIRRTLNLDAEGRL